ncbi:9681_t:CDS:2, partial [Entrophospora sp. SA101]
MEDQAKAPPQILNVAKYLRSTVKTRQGILNGKRVDYFKGKAAIKQLLKEAYSKQKNIPKINNKNEANGLLEELLSYTFYLRAERSGNEGSTSSSRIKNLAITSMQTWKEDQYYVWFYQGSQLKMILGGLSLVSIVFVAVLFPLWPSSIRNGVWYFSVAILSLFGVLMLVSLFRLVLFITTLVVAPPGIWLFPNLFADVGFVESFIPVFGREETKKRENIGHDNYNEDEGQYENDGYNDDIKKKPKDLHTTGSIPEREPEKRLPHPRKAAGAQITQSRHGEEQLEGKSGASSRGNSSSNSSISHLLENGDALNWVSRGTRTFTLKKLECLKQAFCLNTLAWNNKIGRHDSILLVSRITESDDVNFLMTRLAPYGKPKCLGSGGSMVARLKLKGIDGRAPPG